MARETLPAIFSSRFQPNAATSAALLVCSLALMGVLAVPRGTEAVTPVPGSVVLGATTTDITTDSGAALDNLAARAGAMPKIAMYYQDWNEAWKTALLNPRNVSPILARGAVPMITWEPFLDSQDPVDQPDYSLARIASGAFDAHIRRAAREAAAFGQPFFLRFAHEMNGSWTPWGADVNGNSPESFIATWRHVVSIFREEGASNVRWVWSPNIYGNGGSKPFEPFFPGDEWVDVVALDGYNWGLTKPSGWRSFGEVFGPSYAALAALTSKPMMIAETASTEGGGDKASWIREILQTLPTQMPRVRAMLWFDRDKETDWRIDSSPSAQQAFRELAASPLFSGAPSSLLDLPAAEAEAETVAVTRPQLRIGDTRASLDSGVQAVTFPVRSSMKTTRSITARYVVRGGGPAGVRTARGVATIPAGGRKTKLKIWISGGKPGANRRKTRHIWVKLYGADGAELVNRVGKGTIRYR